MPNTPSRSSNAPLLRIAFGCLVAGLAALSQSAIAASGPSRTFLWKVERGTNVGYLMGSIHVLTSAYYPLSDIVERAFAGASTLVEEVDLDEMSLPETQAMMLSKAVYTDGQTLEAAVSRETYDMIAARLKAAGLPIDSFRQMKPWIAAATMLATELQRAGFDPALGLDRHFFDKARQTGKRIVGLETVAFQIDRFDQLPGNLQEALLRETLTEIEVQRDNVKALADAWSVGDAATLERLLLAGFRSFPELHQRLLVERNRIWLPKIENCLSQSAPCFVVVGAAHLVGSDGLISLLTEKGYHLTQQ